MFKNNLEIKEERIIEFEGRLIEGNKMIIEKNIWKKFNNVLVVCGSIVCR